MAIRKPSFLISVLLTVLVAGILGVSILYYQVAPQIPIVIAAMAVALYGFLLGHKWKDIENSMVKSIAAGLPSVLILCMIGILVGIWVLNGTVPTMSYYGLQLLSPRFFLVSAVLICAVASIVTGSSWSAISTMGVALMGVAYGMDISPAMAAGAIVSGAIFGDKVSPLSDTTNLASATAKVDIFEHIRHMMWTAVPSMLATLVIFLFIGFNSDFVSTDLSQIDELSQTLKEQFNLTPLTLLSPLVIIVLALRKTASLPTLTLSLFVAVLTTFYTSPGTSFGEIMNTAYAGYTAETGVESIDSLLSIGGLSGMMFGVSIILVALALGGIVQQVGIAQALIEGVAGFLHRKGNVILTTVLSCMGVNAIIGEQYLSIVLPGQMLESAYGKANLHPKNLSRTLEDAGTIFHAAVPWGITGAFIMSTLNIGMEYALFAFICFINPVIAVLYGYTGFTLVKLDKK
ncbi:Na+/H+ antiporter NhaC [Domibacillus indicus]|uniref:Na+/H+ antiporter NhaC n=1 Tax=Domibacillus indicus TaxID=1437523 RepID=UPI000617A92A|nr:Na+/H+ antiporter NhaC [Domibacillus indicus]